jgi:hypothetical protein
MHPRSRARRLVPGWLALTVLLGTLAACHVAPSDLDQYTRMQGEPAAVRARENVHCSARDLTCARLVQMRGESCAQVSNDMGQTAARRAETRQCALTSARSLPGLLPPGAPDADRDRAAFLIFDAWRVALDGDDPAADPASVRAAADGLAAMPDGEPYGATLRAYASVFAMLKRSVPENSACSTLAAAEQMLPSAPPRLLQSQVSSLRASITATRSSKSCP